MVERRLIEALLARGAGEIDHSAGFLIQHLERTAKILHSWGLEIDTCRAGLFHSVYGTESFSPSFSPEWQRREVQDLIGESAEHLVFAYSQCAQAFLLNVPIDVRSEYVILRGHRQGAVLRVRHQTFKKLKMIATANRQEIAPRFERGLKKQRLIGGDTFFHAPAFSLTDIPAGAIAMFGIPMDIGSPKRGSRRGPKLLREATAAMSFRGRSSEGILNLDSMEYPFSGGKVTDVGDVSVTSLDLAGTIEGVFDFAASIPPDVMSMAVGGDHMLTLPLFCARAQQREIHLIHIDQHLDCQVWGDFDSRGPVTLTPPGHSNFLSHVLARLPELQATQIGVQSFASVGPQTSRLNRSYVSNYLNRLNRITDHQVEVWDDERLLAALPRDRVLYISVDIDVVAASKMIETAYPGAVGISYHRLVHVIDLLFQRNRVIGVDLMEFGKMDTDSRSADSRLAADLCFRLVTLLSIQETPSNDT